MHRGSPLGALRDRCLSLAGSALPSSASYLGAELDPVVWSVQRTSVAALLFKRAVEVVNGGEALGARFVQCRVHCMNLAWYRAEYCALKGRFMDIGEVPEPHSRDRCMLARLIVFVRACSGSASNILSRSVTAPIVPPPAPPCGGGRFFVSTSRSAWVRYQF